MTSNQIAAREARTREKELDVKREAVSATREKTAEARRAAKEKEKYYMHKAAADYLSAFGGLTKAAAAAGVGNHAEWYNLDPQLVKDVASLPYGAPLGTTIPEPFRIAGSSTSGGLMRIVYAPTIPHTGGPHTSSPINVAARNVYAYVRFANSGSKNYEAADLMMYLILMESAMTLYGFALRAYSVVTSANRYNWMIPSLLAKACGFDYASFRDNIANFRYRINAWTQKVSSFSIPGNLPIYSRRFWFASNLFKDSDIKKSQMYSFVPGFIYKYDWENARLIPQSIIDLEEIDSVVDYSSFVNLLDDFLNSLLRIEDVGIMSGDILKAYGEDNLLKFGTIPEDFKIDPVYDLDTLMQIAGGTMLMRGNFSTWNADNKDAQVAFYIDQIDGLIKQVPGIGMDLDVLTFSDPSFLGKDLTQANLQYSKDLWHDYALINQYCDEVTPDQSMRATRLKTMFQMVGSGDTSGTIDACGTEILLWASIYIDTASYLFTNSLQIGSTISISSLRGYGAGSLFTWAPEVRHYYGAESGQGLLGYANIDLANYVFVNRENIQAMHNVACQSLYGVPLIGNRVRSSNNRRRR